MSRKAGKENKKVHKPVNLTNKQLIEEIKSTQEFIKNEDFLVKIAELTLEELNKAKVKQKIKYSYMRIWHFNAILFIKNNIYSLGNVEYIKSWIDENKIKLEKNQMPEEVCIKSKLPDSQKEINEFSENIVSFLSDFKIDDNNYPDWYKNVLFYNPNFIYFISTSFRPIFLSNSINIDFDDTISNLKASINNLKEKENPINNADSNNNNTDSDDVKKCPSTNNINSKSIDINPENIKNVLKAIGINSKEDYTILDDALNNTNSNNQNSDSIDMILNIVNIIVNTIKDIKAQMYKSWELNIGLLPLNVRKYFLSDNNIKSFYPKIRDSFKLIFANPNIFQITYFYESQLPSPFNSSFIDHFFDDSDFEQYYNLLKEFDKNNNDNNNDDNDDNNNDNNLDYDLDEYFKSNDDSNEYYSISLEQSKIDLVSLESPFKELLRYSDLLPDFSPDFYEQVNSLETFIEKFLVQRGNLKDYSKRLEFFDQMNKSIPLDTSMDACLRRIKYDKLKFTHDNKLDIINHILEKRKVILNCLENSFKTFEFTLNVLEFNCIRAIVQNFYENNNKKSAFQKIFSTVKSVLIGKDDGENKNDSFYLIKNPKELKDLYTDISAYIIKNKQQFTPKNDSAKQKDSEIYYDWNTYLIINLVQNITYDKFLAYRQEVKTFDHTYENLFLANQKETIERQIMDDIEEEDQNDDDDDGYTVITSTEDDDNTNDDDDHSNAENQDQSENSNYEIKDEDEKKYNSLVMNLITAFQTFSNPIQKVIDIYESLVNITNFFKNDGKKLFEHKIGESKVNVVENLELNINFNIFDFVCFPNFVSSIIFTFDYYFLPFGRNLKIKTLFIQIYNYAVKKYYTEDRLHFDIVSSEGKLYQHLLSCRQFIKMIFIGPCHKNTLKNSILTNLLKNSLPDKVEENDIFPMCEFVETATELTCHFFKNSTFYFCTIYSIEKYSDIKSLNVDKKNKRQFTGFVFFPDSLNKVPEARSLTEFVSDIKLVHIVCNGQLHYNFMSNFKEVAIIHTSNHFDIKNIF